MPRKGSCGLLAPRWARVRLNEHSNPQRSVLYFNLIQSAARSARRMPARVGPLCETDLSVGLFALSQASHLVARRRRSSLLSAAGGVYLSRRAPAVRRSGLLGFPQSRRRRARSPKSRFADRIDRRRAARRQRDADRRAAGVPRRQLVVRHRPLPPRHPRRRHARRRARLAQLGRDGDGRRVSRAARLHRLSDHGRAHPVHLGPRARRRARRSRHHVPGRRRRRRGQGRSQGNRRFPARAGPLLGDRRPHPEGRAARRPSGHGQDAAGAVDRGRSRRAVPLRQRIGLRRDVCRRRRLARAPAVPRRAPPSVLHRLHRRARRRRPQPRRQLAQPRRARADAQSAARRDGRLRAAPRHRRDCRHQPARHPRSGAAAAGTLRSPGHRRQPRSEGPRGDPARPHAQDSRSIPTSTCASIARGTPGFSGADLANLVNEAALLAARAGRTTVTDGDLQRRRATRC